MIAADTSTWIAFLEGAPGGDVSALDQALRDQLLLMPPVVLTELLSDPELSAAAADLLLEIPLLELTAQYWQRAGRLRAELLAKQRKAKLGDALIAQSCLDRDVALITRDRDFRSFAEAAGLTLVP